MNCNPPGSINWYFTMGSKSNQYPRKANSLVYLPNWKSRPPSMPDPTRPTQDLDETCAPIYLLPCSSLRRWLRSWELKLTAARHWRTTTGWRRLEQQGRPPQEMRTNDDSDGAAAPAGDARKGERDGRCRRQHMNGNNDRGYKNRLPLFVFESGRCALESREAGGTVEVEAR